VTYTPTWWVSQALAAVGFAVMFWSNYSINRKVTVASRGVSSALFNRDGDELVAHEASRDASEFRVADTPQVTIAQREVHAWWLAPFPVEVSPKHVFHLPAGG